MSTSTTGLARVRVWGMAAVAVTIVTWSARVDTLLTSTPPVVVVQAGLPGPESQLGSILDPDLAFNPVHNAALAVFTSNDLGPWGLLLDANGQRIPTAPLTLLVGGYGEMSRTAARTTGTGGFLVTYMFGSQRQAIFLQPGQPMAGPLLVDSGIQRDFNGGGIAYLPEYDTFLVTYPRGQHTWAAIVYSPSGTWTDIAVSNHQQITAPTGACFGEYLNKSEVAWDPATDRALIVGWRDFTECTAQGGIWTRVMQFNGATLSPVTQPTWIITGGSQWDPKVQWSEAAQRFVLVWARDLPGTREIDKTTIDTNGAIGALRTILPGNFTNGTVRDDYFGRDNQLSLAYHPTTGRHLMAMRGNDPPGSGAPAFLLELDAAGDAVPFTLSEFLGVDPPRAFPKVVALPNTSSFIAMAKAPGETQLMTSVITGNGQIGTGAWPPTSGTDFGGGGGSGGPGPLNKVAPTNGSAVSLTPTLSWTQSTGATSYQYCIDTSNNDTCNGGWTTTSGTSAVAGGLSPNTTYYWQARAVNSSAMREADGPAFWAFTTSGSGTGPELLVNGSFDNGMTGWTSYAQPDLTYVDLSIQSGVLTFVRLPGATQAVVLQRTGAVVGAGTGLAAQFGLGNSSSVRKRISVLVHDADFTDLQVCTFWLEPQTPLRTYGIRMRSTEAWSDTTISFYAATVGSNGGAYRVDDVSLHVDASIPPGVTDCVDPTAPAPPGGAAGPTLLDNGNFTMGLVAWGTFGQVAAQVANGVLQFYRPPGTPAGVVLQGSGDAMTTGQILTATFRLGNSSGVRKRVTLLVHDSDFSDLQPCTFWLPAGQPLASYTMRMFTTKAWTDATVSIYPATVGTDQAILLDDVTLQRTPGTAVTGTQCVKQ